jgi:hypothetical protein
MGHRTTRWRPPAGPETKAQRWPAVGIVVFLAVISGVAWVASGGTHPWDRRPNPEPEILTILEEAAQKGTYAYDALSEKANMADGDLSGRGYVMSTTERRRNAPPEGLALVPSGRDCARFAREMAEMRDHLGFCEQVH